jgi:hypothetical protein
MGIPQPVNTRLSAALLQRVMIRMKKKGEKKRS